MKLSSVWRTSSEKNKKSNWTSPPLYKIWVARRVVHLFSLDTNTSDRHGICKCQWCNSLDCPASWKSTDVCKNYLLIISINRKGNKSKLKKEFSFFLGYRYRGETIHGGAQPKMRTGTPRCQRSFVLGLVVCVNCQSIII